MSEMNDQMREGTHKARRSAQDIGNAAVEAIAPVAEQARNAVTEGTEKTRDFTRKVGDTIKDQYGRVSEGAQQAYRSVRDTSQQWEQEMEEGIRRRPVSAVLVAAGVGLLVGFALGRESVHPPVRRYWWR